MSSSKKELVQLSSYSRRLRDNVKSILDNYGEILRTSKVFLTLYRPRNSAKADQSLRINFELLSVVFCMSLL